MRHVRLALEILGSVLYLAVHLPIAFVYILGSSLRGVHPVPYWAAIAAGYLGMLVLALMRPGRLKVTPRRYLLDLWLLAAVPAVFLSWFLAIERWPLEFPNWGGHGFGASGGEVNAAFFPWLQGVLWVLGASMGRTVSHRGSRAACGLTVGLALATATTARAADALSILQVNLDRPTLHALGVQVLISDDDDHDARIDVRYRPLCSSTSLAGPPLFRVRPETVVGLTVPEQLAGSVFDLEPGTSYEIELHAVDADGPVDQIVSVQGTTRPVPAADPATPALRPVTDVASLQAALSSAQAGDVILLRDGRYTGSFFTLNASGTAADPIFLRGESQSGAVLDGGDCTGCNVIEVYGSHVRIEDLTIERAERAIRFQGTGATDNVVRRVVIRDVVHGIGSRAGQTDFLIADNDIAGRLVWPLIYTDDGGLHADDQGVRVEGDGHVVAHNRISGFGDPMINFAHGARSYDFHGNDIREIYGDGTELDRGSGNVRCWGNRFTNVFTAISIQPVYGGPTYVLRNVAANVADEQVKLKSVGGVDEPSGALVWHNSFVSPRLALNLQTPITQHNFSVMANLFVGPAVTAYGYTADWTAQANLDRFDGNGWYPDGSFWLGSVGARRRQYASFAAMQAAGEVEGMGVLLAPPVFASGLVPPPDYATPLAPADFTLDLGSNAVDAGLVMPGLPGIDDRFAGLAPDLGALELGCPSPVYGPRPRGQEHATNLVNCSAPACAPAGDVRRNDEVVAIAPPSPPLATVFPRLRASAAYLAGVAPGVLDPDGTVVGDAARPLVLYELTAPGPILKLAKATTGELRLYW